jgi:hypothetical protein
MWQNLRGRNVGGRNLREFVMGSQKFRERKGYVGSQDVKMWVCEPGWLTSGGIAKGGTVTVFSGW